VRAAASITTTDNGPNLVEGSLALLDAEGNEYEVSNTIALCRCGNSSTKPFCDGTHEKTNFAAVNRAAVVRTASPLESSRAIR
jgi:CDGSH-type Zn-finger protein